MLLQDALLGASSDIRARNNMRTFRAINFVNRSKGRRKCKHLTLLMVIPFSIVVTQRWFSSMRPVGQGKSYQFALL